MGFAARLTDMHICPAYSGSPHIGGPVTGIGVPTVRIGGLIAAAQGDLLSCAGPPDSITGGSSSVKIGGRPAARVGDMTAHGGVILIGCFTVIIGG